MKFSNAESRAREERAFARFAELMPEYVVHRLPEMDPLDAQLYKRGQLAAVVELKCRNVAHDQYPTVYLEDAKRRAASAHLVPGLFMVKWLDALGWVPMHKTHELPVVLRGRRDRGLANDIDEIVEVPVGWFRIHKDAA